MTRDFWENKRVFITGHTGFKGGWLSLWLSEMGAEVFGFALSPPTNPSFYDVTGLSTNLSGETIADLREANKLHEAMQDAMPEIIFHLAAQPLVRYSYSEPVETFEVNVMGTVHLLEAVRKLDTVRAIVCITTDKCYENREWVWPYRENDTLGGYDPYSSSKACTELAVTAYRRSFLSEMGVFLATARAGNVIGGGDWALDRLLPDFLRALDANEAIAIRSPSAVRPWQHVLEPLAGYLMLAEKLYNNGVEYASSWNFGPHDADVKTVQWIVDYLCNRVSGAEWYIDGVPNVHEAGMLRLDASKAMSSLRWQPKWDLEAALSRTLDWHNAWRGGDKMNEVSLAQIREYEAVI